MWPLCVIYFDFRYVWDRRVYLEECVIPSPRHKEWGWGGVISRGLYRVRVCLDVLGVGQEELLFHYRATSFGLCVSGVCPSVANDVEPRDDWGGLKEPCEELLSGLKEYSIVPLVEGRGRLRFCVEHVCTPRGPEGPKS